MEVVREPNLTEFKTHLDSFLRHMMWFLGLFYAGSGVWFWWSLWLPSNLGYPMILYVFIVQLLAGLKQSSNKMCSSRISSLGNFSCSALILVNNTLKETYPSSSCFLFVVLSWVLYEWSAFFPKNAAILFLSILLVQYCFPFHLNRKLLILEVEGKCCHFLIVNYTYCLGKQNFCE